MLGLPELLKEERIFNAHSDNFGKIRLVYLGIAHRFSSVKGCVTHHVSGRPIISDDFHQLIKIV